MPSHFGWVDFAEDDRRRMIDVVKMFQEQETLDELGVGTIRDAFSEYFFPGTSTIQTRARYMLFIPWIYMELEKKRFSGAEMERRARADEIKLIRALLRSEDTEGVIGKEALEKLRRLASSTYWAGLYSWKIRLFPGTQSEYHRHLEQYYRKKRDLLKTDDNEPTTMLRENWDPNLPGPPEKLLKYAELALTGDEAIYLRERVLTEHPESLLSHFLSAAALENSAYLWEQPLISSLPFLLQKAVAHARNFSKVFYGAAILYNLMLARKSERQDLVERYEAQLGEWAASMQARRAELERWYERRDEFWALEFLFQSVPRLTVDFVNSWLRRVFEEGSFAAMVDNVQAQSLIRNRERFLKGARAKLENPKALAAWGGASGNYRLGFRWNNAKRIIADIHDGLNRGPAHA
ncbi:MAG: hypothetical protein GX881_07785 [Firmicutes bacterium]|nr:hypothetical protein [Bacillota bacterium]